MESSLSKVIMKNQNLMKEAKSLTLETIKSDTGLCK